MSNLIVRVINIKEVEDKSLLNYIYVGRYMPGLFKGHPLGNPFKLSRKLRGHEQREECLRKYREWLDALPERNALLKHLREMVIKRNVPLGCWCANWDGVSEPAPQCHAVVLAKILMEMEP